MTAPLFVNKAAWGLAVYIVSRHSEDAMADKGEWAVEEVH